MTLAIPSKDTIVALYQLHPSPSDLIPPPIFYYQREHTFVLDRTLFAQTLTISPHLFWGELFRMVYEHLLRCFILEDPSSRFLKLFQGVATLVRGDIPSSLALVLGANKVLAMANDTGGFRPIVVNEVFF